MPGWGSRSSGRGAAFVMSGLEFTIGELAFDPNHAAKLAHDGQPADAADGSLHRRFAGFVGHQHDLSILYRWIANHDVLLLDDRCQTDAGLAQRLGDLRENAWLVLGEEPKIVAGADLLHRAESHLLVVGGRGHHP